MDTYFIRHTSKLLIDESTRNDIWNKDLIAIHYPTDASKSKGDSRSLNPDDYEGSAKASLRTLHDLGRKGGLVFATYSDRNEVKVGVVKPNTQVKFYEGKWKSSVELDRVARLKTLQLSSVKLFEPHEVISMLGTIPRQSTICRWKIIDDRVERLYNGVTDIESYHHLTSDQMEVMCSEFLRLQLDKRLPVITSFLTPVGRTLRDLDIVGVTSVGEKVFVQVTAKKAPKAKVAKLLKYQSSDCTLLMFSPESYQERDGVTYYPIEDAFTMFTKTETGKHWLKNLA